MLLRSTMHPANFAVTCGSCRSRLGKRPMQASGHAVANIRERAKAIRVRQRVCETRLCKGNNAGDGAERQN